MAKDDATTETVAAKPSKTSPQYARSLRNIMLLDRVLAERNKRYESELKAFLAEKKRLHPDLTGADKEKLEEHFTRNFYGPEYDAMAEFSKLDEKRLPLLEKQTELAKNGKELTKSENEQLTLLNMQVELGPEAYATQRLFDADTVKKFKRDYPEIEKALAAEIKDMAKEGFDNVDPRTRHMPATVALFNKKYPNLEPELNKLKASKDKSTSMLGACAMGMLKAGSVMLNPTGFFVSRAVSGILKTKTFSPLREKAAVGISRVVNKTGLGDWFKRQCSKVPTETLKKVTIGASVAASVAMISLGLIEAEDMVKIKESALAFVDSVDFSPVTNGFENVMDSTRDYFSEPETVMASPDPTKDVSFVDGAAEKLNGAMDAASQKFDETVDSVQKYFVDSGAGPVDEEPTILDGAKNKIDEIFGNVKDFVSPPETVMASPNPNGEMSLIDSLAAEPEVPSDNAPAPEKVESSTPPEQKVDSAVEPTSVEEVKVENGGEKVVQSNEQVAPDAPNPEPEKATPQDVLSALSGEGELFPSAYTVEPGDTLSEIVEERLQAAGVPYNYNLINDYVELVSVNSGISDPNVIMAGQEIDLGSLPKPNEVMSPEQLQEAKIGIDADPTMSGYSPEVKEAIDKSPELNRGEAFTINYQPEQVVVPHVDVEQERGYSPRRMA